MNYAFTNYEETSCSGTYYSRQGVVCDLAGNYWTYGYAWNGQHEIMDPEEALSFWQLPTILGDRVPLPFVIDIDRLLYNTKRYCRPHQRATSINCHLTYSIKVLAASLIIFGSEYKCTCVK